jgi:hypothetical protein
MAVIETPTLEQAAESLRQAVKAHNEALLAWQDAQSVERSSMKGYEQARAAMYAARERFLNTAGLDEIASPLGW